MIIISFFQVHIIVTSHLSKFTHIVTRGHILRLFKKHVHYNLHKYSFGNYIVSIWNSLSDYVINANTIGVFIIDRIIFGVIKHVIIMIKPT